jgi:sugar lactone lactonase YvrE
MDREVAVLYEGLDFGEGPRWHDGRLWLSDFFRHAVLSIGASGDVRVELELDDQPSGLGWLPSG